MMFERMARIVWSLQGLDAEETMWGMDRDEFAQHLRQRSDPIKVRLNVCMIDCGDGSAYPAFFKTIEGAESRCEYELESSGQGFCDAVDSYDIVVDTDGNLLEGTDFVGCDDDDNEIYED